MSTEVTKAKSVKKPADHKPKDGTKATVEHLGETYDFDTRAFKDPRTLFAFKREDIETALERILGEEGLERAIVSTEDEDGYGDLERLSGLVEKLAEVAGAKN